MESRLKLAQACRRCQMYIQVGSTNLSVSQPSEGREPCSRQNEEVLHGTWTVGHTVAGPVEFLRCKICPQSTGLRHEEGKRVHQQCQLCITWMYVATPVDLPTCHEDALNGLFHLLQLACDSKAVSLQSLLTRLTACQRLAVWSKSSSSTLLTRWSTHVVHLQTKSTLPGGTCKEWACFKRTDSANTVDKHMH